MPLCDWMEVDQTYACIDPDVDVGQIVLNGCAVNCLPCDTDTEAFLTSIGLNRVGPRRWVRPSTAKESRDAYGSNRVLVAGTPVRVPRVPVYFEIAPCFTLADAQGAGLAVSKEHWNTLLCDCDWKPYRHSDGTYNFCPETTPGGFTPYYRPAPQPHCWHFLGNRWPSDPGTGTMFCTSLHYGHTPMLVMLAPGPIGEFVNLRLNGGCATNVGVFCWGHREDNFCHAQHEWETEYYNDPHVGMWDYVRVNAEKAYFVAPTGSDDEWQAIQAAKTAALRHLAMRDLPPDGEGVKNFEQLDSVRRYASPAANHNAVLTLWSRSWNLFGNAAALHFDSSPVICEFPGSYLKCSGHAVVVEYVLESALWEMSFVAYRRKNVPLTVSLPSSEQLNATYPMVRHRIECNMGLRVRFPDSAPRYLTRSWLKTPDQVQLTLNCGYGLWPSVSPTNLDQIIFVDSSGRAFNPPLQAVWEGERGWFSRPVTVDVFDHEYWDEQGHTNEYHCKALARGMDNFSTPATESHPDHYSRDRKRIWDGEVTISFPEPG